MAHPYPKSSTLLVLAASTLPAIGAVGSACLLQAKSARTYDGRFDLSCILTLAEL